MTIKTKNVSYSSKIITAAILLSSIGISDIALASEIISNTTSHTQDSFTVVVINFINWSLLIVGFVTLILLILERFVVISTKDKKETEDIRKFLTWIIIGLVIMLVMFKIFAYS